MTPQVIFENEDFVAVNKPAGLLVHRAHLSKGQLLNVKGQMLREHTLVDWLLKKYPQIKTVGDDPKNRPGIVHRLDKDTSGIMLIPKNQDYFDYLKSLFQNSKIKKTYLTLVYGVPKAKEGVIDKPIGIKDGSVKRSVHSEKMAKEAITEYRVLRTFMPQHPVLKVPQHRVLAAVSLLMVAPKTGRTHQIRVHLASIGHPVLGDKLYGGKMSGVMGQVLGVTHQMLHADSIEFQAKPGKVIKLSAEPPEDFVKFLQNISKDTQEIF